MTINVTGRGTNIKSSFHEFLEVKLGKLDRFFREDARAEVTVTNEGGRETVEVTIRSDGMVVRSEATTRDRLDSVDQVVDNLFRQITKNRSKLKSKLRKAAFDPGYADEFEGIDQESFGESYKIVRTKKFALKPMDTEEAILQMDLLGHTFFMFLNSDMDDVCVVYKRDDGNYGLIEPVPGY